MKVSFYTLGCKVNQNETGALEALLRGEGYTIVGSGEAADIYVVNSCTVTAGGDAKSRQWLRRKKRENPTAITVLTGCFPQAFPEEALLPEADIINGTALRSRLPEQLQRFLADGKRIVDITPHTRDEAFEELPVENTGERTRAFVKIEDGCSRRCAYCIIPTARGPVRSRTESSILAELAQLAAQGYREAVFTGINLPSYGKDTGADLAELIEKAAEVPGIERLRLSSLDPDLITPRQIARLAGVDKLCRHFHLSLQSGCDDTLRRMRRPYTTPQYRAVAAALREALPGSSLTTDIIVGFPGETEAEFGESLQFMQEMEFLKVHVFPFSRRAGTPAADFPGQLTAALKAARAKTMQTEADRIRAAWVAARAGEIHEVVLEKPLPNGLFTGYTKNYIPVALPAPGHAQGDIVSATLGNWNGERCLCEIAL